MKKTINICDICGAEKEVKPLTGEGMKPLGFVYLGKESLLTRMDFDEACNDCHNQVAAMAGSFQIFRKAGQNAVLYDQAKDNRRRQVLMEIAFIVGAEMGTKNLIFAGDSRKVMTEIDYAAEAFQLGEDEDLLLKTEQVSNDLVAKMLEDGLIKKDSDVPASCSKCGPDIDPDGFDWNAGHECAEAGTKPTTVAPHGVVGEEILEAYNHAIKCSHKQGQAREYADQCSTHLRMEAAKNKFDAALSKLVQLPEPSEWAIGYIRARQPHTLIGWNMEKRKEIAAALLREREAGR